MNFPTLCTSTRCRRITRHPTRRCHDHRNGDAAAPARDVVLPAPVAPTPAGPTETRTYEDGSTKLEQWFVHGDLSRHGAPAEIRYYPDGSVEHEEWRVHGRFYRENGPAEVGYFPDGSLRAEGFYENARLHRVGAPAITRHDIDGSHVEEWYENGVRHRVDGPAWLELDPVGVVEKKKFYVGGRRLDGPREVGLEISAYSDAYLAEKVFPGTVYRELLDEGVPARRIAEILTEGVQTVDGMREVLGGAPAEWVRSFEESSE